MNPSRKTRVEAPKLLNVKLILRGSAVEPEPEPRAARVGHPTGTALVRSQRRVVKAREKVYRTMMKRVARLQHVSEQASKRSDAHQAKAEHFAGMSRRRYAKGRRYVLEEGRKEIAAMKYWAGIAADRANDARDMWFEAQDPFVEWLCQRAKLETMIDPVYARPVRARRG